MKSIIVLMSLLFLLVGCMTAEEKASENKARSFAIALNGETGDKWQVIQYSSEQPGYMVFRNNSTGVYYAYNVGKWDGTSYSTFASVALPGDIVSPLLSHTVTRTTTNADGTKDTWDDTYYTYGGLRFSNTLNISRDLETVGALREQASQSMMAAQFQSQYSLSSNRAQELAKLTSRYKRLENNRALTMSEKNVFAMSALGVSMNQVESAMKLKAQGDDRAYEDLLETAARVNRTTPEQVGKFFDQMAGTL